MTKPKGDRVRLSPNLYEPKPSDLNIERVAKVNGSIYSSAARKKMDPSASSKFLKAHLNRLIKLETENIVHRAANAEFHIPVDYLARLQRLHFKSIRSQPENFVEVLRTKEIDRKI